MADQIFSVPKIHCTACVMLLESLEDEVDGIERVEANAKQQQMRVEYDELKVSIGDIQEAAKKEGYEAIPLTNY